MKPIAKIHCTDCGWFFINVPEQLALFTLEVLNEGKVYQASTICHRCLRPIIDELPEEVALKYHEQGVKLFSWYTGLEEKVKV